MGGPGSGSNQLGERNPYWKGGVSASRLRRYKGEVCERCGSGQHLVAHHINEDHTDNKPENQQTLCRSCHALHHDMGANLRDRWTSSYRGVCRVKGHRWQAQVRVKGHNNYLGQYRTEEEAYQAVVAFKENHMKNPKRYVAERLIGNAAVHMIQTHHELFRLTHVDAGGFTEAELAFLNKTLDEHKKVMERLIKFNTHLSRNP